MWGTLQEKYEEAKRIDGFVWCRILPYHTQTLAWSLSTGSKELRAWREKFLFG